MSGMNTGLNTNDPIIVAAFRAALAHQGLIILVMLAVLSIVWVSVRGRQAAGRGAAAAGGPGLAGMREPAGRQVLRIGFGILWLVDGALQAQPGMAVGLPSQVIQPSAASSPAWVQHLVNWGATTWSYHPIQAGAAAVWIQAGIGIWLLAAARGPWSRAAGLVSAAWGLIVWVWGESFGGIFAPGLTWLFGAPGAVLFYCAAGALIALPLRAWRSPALGRGIIAAMGVFLAGMAVLQAWPGRGFWQGAVHGTPGALADMTSQMAQTPQPHFLSAAISAFTAFDTARGFAVNLFMVAALAGAGLGLVALTRRPGLLRAVIVFLVVLCLADWVLIQDLGILGGVGTDPNSMIPMALVAVGGYLALTRVPAPAAEPTAEDALARGAAAAGPGGAPAWWRERARSAAVGRAVAAASARSVIALAAIGMIVLGAVPMAAAQASPNADPILAQSLTGSVAPLDYPAKGFTLTDQNGRAVSLASMRGKVVLLTFLDPVCTSACPLIAQEFRAADQLLGPAAHQVELVAVCANPVYYQVADVAAFTRQEYLNQVPNWLFLTGSLPQLRQVWRNYGVAAEVLPAGSMVGHTEIALVIDRTGHVRGEFQDDPGPGTSATRASFASLLAGDVRQVLGSS